MDEIVLEHYDDVYMKVKCEPHILYEAHDHFTFQAPNAKFDPRVKNKFWDGNIRLLNLQTRLIYRGLLEQFKHFCTERNYTLDASPHFSDEQFSLTEANDFIKTLNIPYQAHDHQIQAFTKAVRKGRALVLSPTASGKSLMIYLLARYYNVKTLIVVPTTILVHQLSQDFHDYGYKGLDNSSKSDSGTASNTGSTKGTKRNGSQDGIHRIYAGQEKDTQAKITITTWQSIFNQEKRWFEQFDCIIGDEAHLFAAKSLTGVMTKLTKCKYRFGFTGTLSGTKCHSYVLEGLFGPIIQPTSTAELIKQNKLAKFQIKAIVLQYSNPTRKQVKGMEYHDEVNFLVKNEKRNKFIRNLALSLEGNTLVLFQFVDKHGVPLYNMIKEKAEGRDVHYIDGSVDGEQRNGVRGVVENSKQSVIVASYATFSTGVNVKNLHNLIFASPSKSRIRIMQSIGRVLRKADQKDMATLFDICDDLQYGKQKNYTLNHFQERVTMYDEEQFNYKIYTVKLDD